jgi:hypothetical protein
MERKMKRTCVLVLILAMVGGVVFAQDNTITVDIGPTIIGLAFGSMESMMGGAEDAGVDTTGFGIAAQYERQLMEQLSVGLKVGYLTCGMGMSDEFEGAKTEYGMTLASFSVEAHVRYYLGGTFFLDGMLGYANLGISFSGDFTYEEGGVKKKEKVSFTVPRDYLNFGAKIGWRIDFGNPGGFVFEPSLGYYGGFGLGDSLGAGLSKKIGTDVTELDPMFKMLEDFIFIGGPRVSLAFGFRF